MCEWNTHTLQILVACAKIQPYTICMLVCDHRTKSTAGRSLFEAFIGGPKKMSPTKIGQKDSITGTRSLSLALSYS